MTSIGICHGVYNRVEDGRRLTTPETAVAAEKKKKKEKKEIED
jgi:hypothetical protein